MPLVLALEPAFVAVAALELEKNLTLSSGSLPAVAAVSVGVAVGVHYEERRCLRSLLHVLGLAAGLSLL